MLATGEQVCLLMLSSSLWENEASHRKRDDIEDEGDAETEASMNVQCSVKDEAIYRDGPERGSDQDYHCKRLAHHLCDGERNALDETHDQIGTDHGSECLHESFFVSH